MKIIKGNLLKKNRMEIIKIFLKNKNRKTKSNNIFANDTKFSQKMENKSWSSIVKNIATYGKTSQIKSD